MLTPEDLNTLLNLQMEHMRFMEAHIPRTKSWAKHEGYIAVLSKVMEGERA